MLRALASSALACATVAFAPSALANTFTVTQAGDTGSGSLREAINAANANPGSDTITFNIAQGFILLRSQLPAITGDLTITGTPGQSFILRRDDTNPMNLPPEFPIFVIAGAPTVSFQYLTLSRGRSVNGAGIVGIGGSISLLGCTVTDNTASSAGAGIYLRGSGNASLTITDSIITNNTSAESGAGICFIRDSGVGTLTITNSTVSRNSIVNINPGRSGAGVLVSGTSGPHTLTINGSTITDNTIQSGGFGGGVHFDGAGASAQLSIANSTFSGNTAGTGSAISFDQSSLTIRNATIYANVCTDNSSPSIIRDGPGAGFVIRNSIVSGNISPSGFRDLANGQPATGNNNLVGVGGPFVDGINGNIVGVTDPRLIPLYTNGGLTQTYGLWPDSRAVDAGDPITSLATDQRGQARPSDGDNNGTAIPDIGAFEAQSYIVVNTSDSGAGSLREAITRNNAAGSGFVRFNIPVFGTPKSVQLASLLPAIGRIIYIDGWSQGGPSYVGPPLIEIDGHLAGQGIGLNLQAPDSIIRGIAVNRFDGSAGTGVSAKGVGIGLFTREAVRNWIYGCYIGVGLDGVTDRGNGQAGIWVGPLAISNRIGVRADNVNDAAERNVVGGSRSGVGTGIYIEANSNIIAGNNVGLNVNGSASVPNTNGIWVAAGTSNRIGADPNSPNPAGERNVVCANSAVGINLSSQGSNNQIVGNYVGVRPDGLTALGNGVGIQLDNVTNSMVGGSAGVNARNVVSGNTLQGIVVTGLNANNNSILGNYIGVTAAGDAPLPNQMSGILLTGGTLNTRIGVRADGSALDPNRRNVISGNNGKGIEIAGSIAAPTSGAMILGNYIGTSATGAGAIGNALAGVCINNSKNNTVGSVGSGVTGRNIIVAGRSMTSGHGVEISGADATGNKIINNSIGLDSTAMRQANSANGVFIADNANTNIIGGFNPGEGNLIHASGLSGVRVAGASSVGNTILGNSIYVNNSIGIDLSGDAVTANAPAGAIRTGPNALQNYPVIQRVSADGVITATLAAKAFTSFRIEFFSSPMADKSGFGEGRTFLGATTVTTDATGNTPVFTFSFTPDLASPWISATATELLSNPGAAGAGGTTAAMNTSEFSLARAINTAPQAQNVAANGFEDTDLTITLSGTDLDTDPLSFIITSLPPSSGPGAGQLLQFGTLAPITSSSTPVADAQGRVIFRPAANLFGTPFTSFTFSSNDGLVSSSSATATINLVPRADTPSVTNASTPRNQQSTSGLVITRSAFDGAEVTHFKISALSSGSLFLSDGLTPVANNAFITAAQASAGLRFTPAANFIGPVTFSVYASLSNTDAGIGGSPALATITVQPAPLTPSITPTTTPEDTQSTSGLVLTPDAADAGVTTHFKITSITNGQLYLTDGVTAIVNNTFVTVAQATAGLKFTPSPNYFGSASFNAQASLSNTDAGLGATVISAAITVTPVADTPSITSASTLQGVQTTLGLVITRNPADGTEVTHFKITNISNGQLFLNDGITPVANNSFITFAQANAGLKYTPPATFVGNATFNVRASLSNTDAGIGGSPALATITVAPQAFTPSITPATTPEDTQSATGLVVSRNANNGAEVTHVKVMSITNGQLFLANGLTPVPNNSFITFAQANAGLRFTPAPNFHGPASISVQASISDTDAGLGGSITTAPITVTPIADTPSVTPATTFQGLQTTSGLVIARNPVDGPEVTHFKITGIINGQLFLNDGVTPVNNGSFITFTQASAGLRFTPANLYVGTTSFNVQASLSNTDAGLGGSPVFAFITVGPRAFTPSVSGSSTVEDTQTTSGLVITRSSLNGPEVTHFKITGISGGQLFQADGLAPIANSSFITVAQGTAGLKFTPTPNTFGPASFSVQASISATDDGIGGSPALALITVAPVADTPSVTNAATFTDTQTASGLVITRNAADSAEVSHFRITNITSGTLFLNNGVTPVTNGAFITVAQGNAGLKFTPAPGFTGDGTFNVQASLNDDLSGLGGGLATATITVTSVNTQPNFSAANPPAVLESRGSVSIPHWVTSFDPGRPSESAQKALEYIVDNVTNTSLLAGLPTVSSTGTLSYTTAATGYGTATFRIRVRDDGGTANGGNDTSEPRTFTITVRPAAVCRDVTIDARRACVPLTVSEALVNATPAGPDGATQSFTYSRSLSQPFPIGTTNVVVRLTYSDGLTSSCTARVTVLAEDCNNNLIPDACDIAGGASKDCNTNGVPDECECLWDNGMVDASGAATANGQLSHEGGGVPLGAKTIDDFYLPPGQMHRIFNFTAQMITNVVAPLRKARVELYEDCDGRPLDTPFKTITKSIVLSTVPSGSGYDLVTFSFNLCDEALWLEGGKTYWIAVIGGSDFSGADSSFWVTTTRNNIPGAIMGAVPYKKLGTGSPTPNTYSYPAWQPADICCSGCVNLAFKIGGESCKIIWDNGLPQLDPTLAGGSPSGAEGSSLPPPRTVDNFIVPPCVTAEICHMQATIFTNCLPVRAFAEIYPNECSAPGQTPLFTANTTTATPLNTTVTYNGRVLQGYLVTFTNPGWALEGGKTYWISFGAPGGGGLFQNTLWSYTKPNCLDDSCLYKLTPGRIRRPFLDPTLWNETMRDYSFRISARFNTDVVGGSTPAPAGCPLDIDGDGAANIDDIFLFMNNWFRGCP
jgi:hypothetical protein